MTTQLKVSIYSTSDWVAIYVDWELQDQGHSFSPDFWVAYGLNYPLHTFKFFVQLDDGDENFPENESEINLENFEQTEGD